MSEITPALTPEEWARESRAAVREMEGAVYLTPSNARHIKNYVAVSDATQVTDVPHRLRHACAALCLYEQPYGFTREDVDALEAAYSKIPIGPLTAQLYRLRDRIAALLPPDPSP